MPTLQSYVDTAGAGLTITPPGGIYRELVFVSSDKTGLTIDGSNGVDVRGTDDWSPGLVTWTSISGVWVSSAAIPFFDLDPNGATYGGQHVEQVYIDGVVLAQVPGSPGSTEFALNTSRQVVLSTNPAGHLIEVTTRNTWMICQASNVTYKKMSYHHACSAANAFAIGNNDQAGWLMDSCLIDGSHGSAIGIGGGPGKNPQVLNSTIKNAGNVGVLGYLVDHGLLQGCDISGCGSTFYDPGFSDGGVKLVTTNFMVVDSNLVHDNFGGGIWFDIWSTNTTISNNRVHHNVSDQIHYEISSTGRIFNNKVWTNGPGGERIGLFISSSGSTEVYNNVVYGTTGEELVLVIDADRSDKPSDHGTNIYVHDNFFITEVDNVHGLKWWDSGTGIITDPSSNNRASNNLFWWPNPENGNPRFQWGNSTEYSDIASFDAVPGGITSAYMDDATKNQIVADLPTATTGGDGWFPTTDGPAAWIWGYTTNAVPTKFIPPFLPPSTEVVVKFAPVGSTMYASAIGPQVLALTDAGNVWAWGDNTDGIAATGGADLLPARTWTQIPFSSPITDIGSGTKCAFALDSDNNLWAWGADGVASGNPTGLASYTPFVTLASVTLFGAGQDFTVARTTAPTLTPVSYAGLPHEDIGNTYLEEVGSDAFGEAMPYERTDPPLWCATRVVVTDSTAVEMIGAAIPMSSIVAWYIGPPHDSLIMDLYTDAGEGPGTFITSGSIQIDATDQAMLVFGNRTDTRAILGMGQGAFTASGVTSSFATADGHAGLPVAVFDTPVPVQPGVSFWVVSHMASGTLLPYRRDGVPSTPPLYGNIQWIFFSDYVGYLNGSGRIDGLEGDSFYGLHTYSIDDTLLALDQSVVYTLPDVGTYTGVGAVSGSGTNTTTHPTNLYLWRDANLPSTLDVVRMVPAEIGVGANMCFFICSDGTVYVHGAVMSFGLSGFNQNDDPNGAQPGDSLYTGVTAGVLPTLLPWLWATNIVSAAFGATYFAMVPSHEGIGLFLNANGDVIICSTSTSTAMSGSNAVPDDPLARFNANDAFRIGGGPWIVAMPPDVKVIALYEGAAAVVGTDGLIYTFGETPPGDGTDTGLAWNASIAPPPPIPYPFPVTLNRLTGGIPGGSSNYARGVLALTSAGGGGGGSGGGGGGGFPPIIGEGSGYTVAAIGIGIGQKSTKRGNFVQIVG